MELSKKEPKEKPRDLWKDTNPSKYQLCVTISPIDSTIESEEVDEKVVYVEDLEKRKEVYGICGECNEPGTGWKWCQPCNAKRLEENFKNWTSGNKDIDELIQHSQLNATYHFNCLEWVPYEKFQKITFIAKGGFGKIHSADWPEGKFSHWDIENQKWIRYPDQKVVLKSLDNSSDMSTDFLNEIKSHLKFYSFHVVPCLGITQNPDTKDYMMALTYCENGDLRNYLNQSKDHDYVSKIQILSQISKGLLEIHDAGIVHKDFHSGNILLLVGKFILISDLGLCRPANNEKKEGIYGVLPYVAPEVLCGSQYTKAADIYSFGIMMNELMSEEVPYGGVPHNHILSIGICQGLRPKISEDTPKLLADLIIKCLDAKAENRPTAKELYQILNKWTVECGGEYVIDNNDDDSNDDDDDNDRNGKIDKNSKIYVQIEECRKIRKNKPDKNEPKTINQSHSQAVYTSRLLNFKSLPEPANSSDLSPFQHNTDTMLLSVEIQFQNMWSKSDPDETNQDDPNEK